MVQHTHDAGEKPKQVPPILAFSSPGEFRARHEAATKAEFEVQQRKVNEFNNLQPALEAWVITAPPAHQPGMGYILRVHFSFEGMREKIDPPGIGQSCELRFLGEDGTPSSWCFCQSGAEIIALGQSWNDTIEFVAYPTQADVKTLGDSLDPLLRSNAPAKLRRKTTGRSVKVNLKLKASKTTMLAELGALDRLINGEASERGMNAFNYLMSFSNPKIIFDLSTRFPHLADLREIPDAELREAWREMVGSFDEDQERAISSITSLPDRICFVPGGPGSGKTWWALTMALIAQCGVEPCKILYLVDINKPVDDAVDRAYAMCGKLGMKKSLIRVSAWALGDDEEETEDDSNLSQIAEDDSGIPNGPPRAWSNADFTEGFLRAMSPMFPRGIEKAPTLDQACWESFLAQPTKYPAVSSALTMLCRVDSGDRDTEADLDLLRKALIPLYSRVLLEADFVATTPVAATRLGGAYNPDIVIFDECAHARECSTLISLAHFEPEAWIFVGDHRQTEPFVAATDNEFASQLKMSTIERADKNGAITFQLLVNHRAYGGLEQLASDLFYDGAMRSGMAEGEHHPPGVDHLRNWLPTFTVDGMVTRLSGSLRTPRLVVSHDWAPHSRAGSSSWNSRHQAFVMKQIDALLQDRNFQQVGSSEPGTIMILSPYKAATKRYQGCVNRLSTQEMKRRVQVRTVDTAQGQEADVVFLDMARTRATPHMANSKRLCVALTRARQAEVIMMAHSVVKHMNVRENLAAIWQKCESGEEGAVMFVHNKEHVDRALQLRDRRRREGRFVRDGENAAVQMDVGNVEGEIRC